MAMAPVKSLSNTLTHRDLRVVLVDVFYSPAEDFGVRFQDFFRLASVGVAMNMEGQPPAYRSPHPPAQPPPAYAAAMPPQYPPQPPPAYQQQQQQQQPHYHVQGYPPQPHAHAAPPAYPPQHPGSGPPPAYAAHPPAYPPSYPPPHSQQWAVPQIELPPLDIELKNTIDKTAAYVARNGERFEAMIREREGSNPKFIFLQPEGDGAGYYKWRRYMMEQGSQEADLEQQVLITFPQPSPEEAVELNALFAELSGTKESIRALRTWVMEHSDCIEWICHRMAARFRALEVFNSRLFLVYGINDVLHGCLKKRPEGSQQIVDPMSAKAMPYIMKMLAIFGKQGLSGEDREKVTKMTKLWAERGIYTQNECALMDACLATGTVQAPPPYPGTGTAAPLPQGAPPPYAAAPPAYPQGPVIPPGMIPPGMAPPGYAAGPPPLPPTAPPKPLWATPDDMPPGIVVAVSNIMRSGGSPAYTPILPQICPVAPPPPGPQTQQLLDSIDAFYKEPSVTKLAEKRRERVDKEAKRLEREAEEEAARQAAEKEKEAAEAAEKERLEAETAKRIAAGIGVPAGSATTGKNWATPRKTVAKQSNKIKGVDKRKRQEEDEDIADVFKM